MLPDAAFGMTPDNENRFSDGVMLKIKTMRLWRQTRLPGLSRAGKYAGMETVLGGDLRNPDGKAVLRGPRCSRRNPAKGAVAQMGERCNRTAEASGSIPLSSTKRTGNRDLGLKAGTVPTGNGSLREGSEIPGSRV